MSDKRFNLKFHAQRNANYHMAREKWFGGLHRIVTFLIILTGTGVVSQFASSSCLGFAIAALGGAQLVFDFSGNEKNHNTLRRRYLETVADIEAQKRWTAEFEVSIRQLHTNLMSEEPPTYRALEAIAHNQLTDAWLGKAGADEKTTLRVWHKLLRHVYTFPDTDFTK